MEIARGIVIAGTLWTALAGSAAGAGGYADVIESAQPKMVKIFGAGGRRGLEHYQSGFLISGDGHVLTAWSYVLDTDYVSAVLDDGRRFQATLVGADPRLEIAVIENRIHRFAAFHSSPKRCRSKSEHVCWPSAISLASRREMKGRASCTDSWRPKPRSPPGGALSKRPTGAVVYVLDAMTNNPGAAGAR